MFSENQNLRRLLLGMVMIHDRHHRNYHIVADDPDERKTVEQAQKEIGWVANRRDRL